MNFFTLQIVSNTRGVLYSSDLELQTLEGFAKLLASGLVRYNVFREREHFAMRIVPHWTGEPCLDKYELPDARSLPQLTNAFVDFVFEEAVRPDPVKYFTLRWHSADRNLVYQQDLHVRGLLEAPVSVAVSRLLERGQLEEGENFMYLVFVRNQGLPTIDPELLSRVSAYTTAAVQPSPEPSGNQELPKEGAVHYVSSSVPSPEPSGRSDLPKRNFKIAITGRKPLVTPQTKDPSAYAGLEAIRQVSPGALRVYLDRKAFVALREPAKASREKQVEVAGALLGRVCTDPSGQLFVEVEEAVPAPEAQGDAYSVRMDSEVWRGLIESVNLRNPNRERVLVGWYHTHLVSKLSMTASSPVGGEMQASRRTFMSADDIYIHENYFPQPWHVALILDLSKGQEVFFFRRDKELVDCGGFFVFGENPERLPK